MNESRATDESQRKRELVELLLSSGLETLFIGVTEPVSNGTVNVRPGYPGACTGSATIRGTAHKEDAMRISVYVVVNGMTTFANWNADGTWEVEVQGVHCENSHCPSMQNSLEAFAEWYTHNGVFTGESTGIIPFNGTPVEQTGGEEAGTTGSLLAGRLLEPIREIDGWLEYRDVLSSGPFDAGAVLMRGGQPLTASAISVYAPEVAWYLNGVAANGIYRPSGLLQDVKNGLRLGNFQFGAEPWRFATAPKGAICLYQPCGPADNRERVHVIAGRQETNADRFPLLLDQPIRVRVNDVRNAIEPHRGGFVLRVRVEG